MNRRIRAFTLIEIVVAISIILVLMGMVILGVRKVNDSSRSNSTKVTLEQCRSMVSEYGRAQGLPLPTEPFDLTGAPHSTATPVPTTAVLPYWPGDLRKESNQDSGVALDTGRYGVMVRLTSAVIARMMQAPAIKTSIQGQQANNLLVIPPGVTMPVAPVFAAGTFYPTQISQGNGVATPYMCMTRHTTVAGANDPGAGTLSASYWLDLSIPAQAVLTDGFGNPLLYFPSCGFITGTSGSGKWITSAGTFTLNHPDPYWTVGRNYTASVDYVVYQEATPPFLFSVYKCILNHTAAVANDPVQTGGVYWVRMAAVPFFASAGPDGFFFDPTRPETLDDNMYSFEN